MDPEPNSHLQLVKKVYEVVYSTNISRFTVDRFDPDGSVHLQVVKMSPVCIFNNLKM